MQKSLSKYRPHRTDSIDSDASDGYYLLIALLSVFVMSTLAIMLGLGLAMI
jgi:hypothetical protein